MSDKEDDIRRRLTPLFNVMMRAMFRQEGSQFSVDILASDEAQAFIDEHASVLNSTFAGTEMSDAMRNRLQRSNWIFSGMKTFHELNEAFPSLLDENGNRKPFEQFLNDVRAIDETYNANYLRAEYGFVQASAEMAAKWEQFAEDGDRYNLQYRTAGDDKVRPEHAALNGVTLPPSDPFWADYYPPNGWGCRCTVVQVRKSRYPQTDSDEAMELGEVALQTDKKGIFRFNPGMKQQTFSDYNPYTIRRCNDCDVTNGKEKLAFVPDYQMCQACKLIRECYIDREKANAKDLKHYTPEEKHSIYVTPLDEQFKDVVFKDGSGHTVSRHTLKDVKAMDYERVLSSAKLFAKYDDVKILPEIHKSEVEIRQRLGLNDASNPDLLVGDTLIDVKSPFSIDNITYNANKAAAQGAIACITDHLTALEVRDIYKYAKKIFKSGYYNYDTVFFIVRNRLYQIRTADI